MKMKDYYYFEDEYEMTLDEELEFEWYVEAQVKGE